MGTMIDDLVSKDLREPYRVLTSRSEYQLLLRGDNADRRLTPMGRELGLVDDRRWRAFEAKQKAVQAQRDLLETTRLKAGAPAGVALAKASGAAIKGSISLADLLRRPGVHSADLLRHGLIPSHVPVDVRDGAGIDVKYSGYLERQRQQIAVVRKQHGRPLAPTIPYPTIATLSKEARGAPQPCATPDPGAGQPHSGGQSGGCQRPPPLAGATAAGELEPAGCVASVCGSDVP